MNKTYVPSDKRKLWRNKKYIGSNIYYITIIIIMFNDNNNNNNKIDLSVKLYKESLKEIMLYQVL